MAGRIIDVTMQLIDKVTQPLQSVTSSLTESNKQWQRAGKDITKTGQSLSRAGQALTTSVTMPIVAAGTGAVMTAANFEAGMSKVQAISGATTEDMDALSKKAQEMGGKTKFSATEAADAFSYMAMAGWKTEQMMSGIEGVMYLAGATGTDLAMTSDIVTDAMTAFGMAADGTSKVVKDGVEVEVSNATRFVDVLAATANNANTNVEMLGESFKYVAPVAGALGYSVEDVNLGLGLMANSGIKASQAGTSLRTLLTNMANPSDQMAAAMETLGVSLEDDQGNMLSFMDVMRNLRSGFGDLKMSVDDYNAAFEEVTAAYNEGRISEKQYMKDTDELINRLFGAEGAQKAQAAAMLAGKTGMSGLLAIVNSSDEDFDKLTQAINNSNGACEEMYNISQNNLMGQITVLKSSVEALAISFGNTLMPYIEKGAEYIQGLVNKFNSMDEATRLNIVKVAGFAAAIGPVLLTVGKLTIGIGNVVSAVGKIGGAIKAAGGVMAALTGPGAIVVAVLAAIGVAIALVVTHWDQVKAAALAFWDAVQPIVQHFQEKWEELGTTFRRIWTEHIQPAWENFSTKAQEVWSLVQPIIKRIGDFAKEVFELKFKAAIDIACEVFEFLGETIGTVIETAMGVLSGIIDFVVGVFTGDWDRAWNGVKDAFSSAMGGLESIASSAVDTVCGILQGIADFVSGLFDSISGLGDKAKEEADKVPSSGSNGHFAVGTSFFRGGTATIHERGAEIVDLPRGTRIYPHSESLKMAYNEGRAVGSGRGVGNISINIPKLADNITVRSSDDIEAIAVALANKLEQTAQNIGGGELGYIY